MAFPPAHWPLRRHRPFCCLPSRLGTIVVLGLAVHLIAIFSVILWFEYANASSQLLKTRLCLLLAAILQNIFVLISASGFVGVFWNKRPLITVFAYANFAHLVANVIVIAYFLSNIETSNQCPPKPPPRPEPSRAPCDSFRIPKAIYVAAAVIVLLIELYNALVITTYLYQLRGEDEDGQETLILSSNKNAFPPRPVQDRQRLLSDSSAVGLVPQRLTSWEYYNPAHNAESSSLLAQQLGLEAAEGYGGGRLSYNDIQRDEKARLREMDESGESSLHLHVNNEPPVVRPEMADMDLPSYHAASV